MESDEDDEETQASFCGFLDDNFKLPISAYAPGCVPKVEIKERLNNNFGQLWTTFLGRNKRIVVFVVNVVVLFSVNFVIFSLN